MQRLALSLLALCIVPLVVFSAEAEPKLIKITVRTIQATKRGNNFGTAPVAMRSEAQKFDNSLSDLEKKLMDLPYQTFHLIAAKEEELCVKKKQSMLLPNGQSLAFRPVRMEDKKLGLWISWRDSEDGEILNTRLHFDTDYSVITGTEETPETGLILAIKAAEIKPVTEQEAQH